MSRLLCLVLALIAACGCGGHRGAEDPAWQSDELINANAERGREVIERYGCPTCHMIPGVRGADGLVGPPLLKLARRSYIAGRTTNTPAHLIAWIRNPQSVDEKTAMPNMNVTDRDARDIVAYLLTLR